MSTEILTMGQARKVYRRVATTFTFRQWSRQVLHMTRVRGKLAKIVTEWWARQLPEIARIVSPRGDNRLASYGNYEQFREGSAPLEEKT